MNYISFRQHTVLRIVDLTLSALQREYTDIAENKTLHTPLTHPCHPNSYVVNTIRPPDNKMAMQ